MTHKPIPLTPDQVKERLRRRGTTITKWAQTKGYERRDVYRVLNGQLKAHYGRAYEIAVALGLIVPDSEAEPSTAGSHRNAQSRRVA